MERLTFLHPGDWAPSPMVECGAYIDGHEAEGEVFIQQDGEIYTDGSGTRAPLSRIHRVT